MSVDINVKGRHTAVSESFREHVEEKLSRIERFDAKVIRIDVEVSEEHNPRLHDQCERVEITVVSRGPVVRAEACAADRLSSLDIAIGKLESQLRRAADRRRVHHGGKSPVSVAAATAPLAGWGEPEPQEDEVDDAPVSPVVIREKTHDAVPMTVDQALYEMELVGHDFFLYVDAASLRPSVVYRRKGWDYGVIGLDITPQSTTVEAHTG